jgi:hypothetical protein
MLTASLKDLRSGVAAFVFIISNCGSNLRVVSAYLLRQLLAVTVEHFLQFVDDLPTAVCNRHLWFSQTPI